jgi:hypothetical protein
VVIRSPSTQEHFTSPALASISLTRCFAECSRCDSRAAEGQQRSLERMQLGASDSSIRVTVLSLLAFLFAAGVGCSSGSTSSPPQGPAAFRVAEETQGAAALRGAVVIPRRVAQRARGARQGARRAAVVQAGYQVQAARRGAAARPGPGAALWPQRAKS